jgi:hypothetical protein
MKKTGSKYVRRAGPRSPHPAAMKRADPDTFGARMRLFP